MKWLKRLLCVLDEHETPPAWNARIHDPWVTCTRCGERFDAAEQQRMAAEDQAFRP